MYESGKRYCYETLMHHSTPYTLAPSTMHYIPLVRYLSGCLLKALLHTAWVVDWHREEACELKEHTWYCGLAQWMTILMSMIKPFSTPRYCLLHIALKMKKLWLCSIVCWLHNTTTEEASQAINWVLLLATTEPCLYQRVCNNNHDLADR